VLRSATGSGFFRSKNQRDQGCETAAEEDPIEAHFATAEPEPSAQLQQQQAIRQLDAALHCLPLRQQQVFCCASGKVSVYVTRRRPWAVVKAV